MDDQLHMLLNKLRRDGRYDSMDRFTIEAKQACEKLARFLLADPDLMLLDLTRWGVAARATSLEFTIDRHGIQLVHDGEATDTDNPLAAVLGEDAPRRYLGRAMLGAEAGFEKVELTREGNRSRFTAKARGNVFSRTRAAGRRRSLLGERARFAPVPIRVNGQPLNPGRFGAGLREGPLDVLIPGAPGGKPLRMSAEHHVWEARFSCRRTTQSLVLDSPSQATFQTEASHRQAEPGLALPAGDTPEFLARGQAVSGALGANVSRHFHGDMLVLVADHGILLEPIRLTTQFLPNCQVLTTAGGLRLDLSGFEVVEDERWLSRANELEGAVRKLTDPLRTPLDDVYASLRRKLVQ